MLRSFSEHSKLFEKIEFKEKFKKEIFARVERSDRIANYLVDYMKNNDDEMFDWVEIADMFATNRLIITSKNNKPQVMKMSRFLRKILPSNLFSADEIDKFVFNILSNQVKDTYFEMWHGEDIRKAFNPDNFLVRDGDLANSCMSSKTCLPYFDLYTKNKNIYMLVLLHETKIVARAIVWNALYSDGKRVQNIPYHVMDKVYAINTAEGKKMIQHANENSWLHYYEHGEYFEDKNGKGYYGQFIVKLQNVDFPFYPFVDNMMYLDKDRLQLSNRNSENSYHLSSKDGSLPNCKTCQGEMKILCPECGGTGTNTDHGDVHFGETCKTCQGTAYVECPTCNKNV